MNINELKEFLVKAKKSTYANSNAPKIESTRLDSKDYEYEEAMDKALRPALMQVGTDNSIPVRGPKEYYNDEYSYTFEYSGELDNFQGKEQIKKSDNLIYELNCHGGFIK